MALAMAAMPLFQSAGSSSIAAASGAPEAAAPSMKSANSCAALSATPSQSLASLPLIFEENRAKEAITIAANKSASGAAART
jgi:hypothetical protein